MFKAPEKQGFHSGLFLPGFGLFHFSLFLSPHSGCVLCAMRRWPLGLTAECTTTCSTRACIILRRSGRQLSFRIIFTSIRTLRCLIKTVYEFILEANSTGQEDLAISAAA